MCNDPAIETRFFPEQAVRSLKTKAPQATGATLAMKKTGFLIASPQL
jgi:hypothetical protein